METNKISVAFKSTTDAKLLGICSNVLSSMTNNLNFKELSDKVEELRHAHRVFEDVIPSDYDRSIQKVREKNDKRDILIPILQDVAYSVMAKARGNVSILVSSGFPLYSSPTKKTIPTTPKDVRVFLTNNPDVILGMCKADKNTGTYLIRVSEDQKTWRWPNAGSSRKLFVPELPLGVILYVQMASKNRLGQSPWSESERIRLPTSDEPVSERMNISFYSDVQ